MSYRWSALVPRSPSAHPSTSSSFIVSSLSLSLHLLSRCFSFGLWYNSLCSSLADSPNPSCFPVGRPLFHRPKTPPPPTATRTETHTHLRDQGILSPFLFASSTRASAPSFRSSTLARLPTRYLFPVIQKFATHPRAPRSQSALVSATNLPGPPLRTSDDRSRTNAFTGHTAPYISFSLLLGDSPVSEGKLWKMKGAFLIIILRKRWSGIELLFP